MRALAKRIGFFVKLALPAVVYIMWIEVYYWLLGDRRYQAFMQPKLWPLLLLALILLLIFIASIISRLLQGEKDVGRNVTWIRALVLLVPVVFVWTVYGQSLGTHAFSKKSFAGDRTASIPGLSTDQRFSEHWPESTVSLLALVKDPDGFDGQHIAIDGIVYRDSRVSDNVFRLFRFMIICCAADAIPISVRVESDEAKSLSNDTWVRVEGQVYIDRSSDQPQPRIAAQAVRPIPEPPPEKRYLFF